MTRLGAVGGGVVTGLGAAGGGERQRLDWVLSGKGAAVTGLGAVGKGRGSDSLVRPSCLW